VGQVLDQGGVGVLGVHQVLQLHTAQDGGQLPLADAVTGQVDGLELLPALLELALGLFGVERFGLAENLNVHHNVLLGWVLLPPILTQFGEKA
jgi:hypothetical protein